MPARAKKPTAARFVEINLNLKVPRKQYPMVEEALTAVLDLAGVKFEKDDQPTTPPKPRIGRPPKAVLDLAGLKPEKADPPQAPPKPKIGRPPKAKPGKAKTGPRKQPKGSKAKPAPKAKPVKMKTGPKKPAKTAPGRRSAADQKTPETAALIRDLRIKAGLSQKALAEKLNTNQNAISLLEIGKRKPSLDMSIKLGQILKIPFQDLQK